MQKRTIFIVLGLVALAVLGGGVWHFTRSAPVESPVGDTGARANGIGWGQNMAATRTPYILPIPELSEEEWPYDRPAEHLYIQKGITLDPTVITINHELKDVTLCGTTYKSKQVMIDGVDVVQRVAELFAQASATTSGEVCGYLTLTPTDLVELGGYVGKGGELQIVIHKSDPSDPNYLVSVSIAKSLYTAGGSWSTGLQTWVGVSKNKIRFGSPTFGPSIDASLHEQ